MDIVLGMLVMVLPGMLGLLLWVKAEEWKIPALKYVSIGTFIIGFLWIMFLLNITGGDTRLVENNIEIYNAIKGGI